MYRINGIDVTDSFASMLAAREDKLRTICEFLDRDFRVFSGNTGKFSGETVNFLDCVFMGSPDKFTFPMRQVKEILDSEKPCQSNGKSIPQSVAKEKKKKGGHKK